MPDSATSRTTRDNSVIKSENPRTRRPSLSYDDLLTQVLEVFIEKGFDGASIDSITASVGIAKKTVYARYRDKQTLFKAAIDHAIDRWIMPVEQLQSAETEDFEETLLAIGHLLVENILTPTGLALLRLTNAESARMPEIGQHNVQYGQAPTLAYLADLFRRRLHLHDQADIAEDAAEGFLHLVVGSPANAAAWGVIKDNDAIARRAQLSIKIFARGLLSVVGAPQTVIQTTHLTLELDEMRQSIAVAEAQMLDALKTLAKYRK